ncbi:dihydrofolate reductase-like [Branchiostoma floridae x Branchiostoma belcheri]
MKTKKLSLVVAACNNMGIGVDGKIPWTLRGDLKFFSRLTSGTEEEGKQNAVVMGRKTWFSIPDRFRPLPKRLNVVLSRNLTTPPEGAHHLAGSLEEAVKMLTESPVADSVDKVFIIGGNSVYKDALSHPCCHRVYLTRVYKDFTCDTFFPSMDDSFKLVSDPGIPSEMQEENGIEYKYEVYEKVE